jgi:leader peptidase (prepilin peptidase) / N-methyltransferase
MIRILGTIFAGLFGLAFGSFLNVCLSRWPEGESVVHPHSHCRNCEHTLSWWENIPLVSWIILRGRCRNCYDLIGWRYPLVEFAIAALWSFQSWKILGMALDPETPAISPFIHFNLYNEIGLALGTMIFYWLLVAMAVLDAENLWLPNSLTYPGIALGFVLNLVYRLSQDHYSDAPPPSMMREASFEAGASLVGILAAGLLILLIRWLYKLVRHREGMGLGDAKLMAMLAAWLGLPGALLAFTLGVLIGSLAALVLLIFPAARRDATSFAASKLPLGTFLCIGGIISSLWGPRIVEAYLRWVGLVS